MYNMYDLKPLLPNVQEVQTFKGRFPVQLEIPHGSALTQSDVQKIGALASWELDPNSAAEGYEGLRSVLISRQETLRLRGYAFNHLQISGIGFRETSDNSLFADVGETFLPPESTNFMDRMDGTKMSTTYVKNGAIFNKRPEYRPTGTYASGELATKVRNTIAISHVDLETLVLPTVEAYGRYLCPELADAHGQFGFMVTPVPRNQRISDEILHQFIESVPRGLPVDKAVVMYLQSYFGIAAPLLAGLRELHDKRLAHLQAHIGNAYSLGQKACLVDWATLTRMGKDSFDNTIMRALDVQKVCNNYLQLFDAIFSTMPNELREHTATLSELHGTELALELYAGQGECSLLEHLLKAERSGLHLGGRVTATFDGIVQWMIDMKYEGESIQLHQPKNRKIGRNDPCTCGSGLKYKRCCGR